MKEFPVVIIVIVLILLCIVLVLTKKGEERKEALKNFLFCGVVLMFPLGAFIGAAATYDKQRISQEDIAKEIPLESVSVRGRAVFEVNRRYEVVYENGYVVAVRLLSSTTTIKKTDLSQ
jgi:hypothetical protein